MYKVKNDLAPLCFKNLFGHTEALSGKLTVNKGLSSLRNFGPVLWNPMLPRKYKTCICLDEFKNMIKHWIPDNCSCTLCQNYLIGKKKSAKRDQF